VNAGTRRPRKQERHPSRCSGRNAENPERSIQAGNPQAAGSGGNPCCAERKTVTVQQARKIHKNNGTQNAAGGNLQAGRQAGSR